MTIKGFSSSILSLPMVLAVARPAQAGNEDVFIEGGGASSVCLDDELGL